MKTHIHVILDKSGSMSAVTNDTIGGFNTWLDKQKQAEGKQALTLTLFDTEITKPYTETAIDLVAPLTAKTYVPGGATALLDAIGQTINAVSKKAKKVLVLIMTDGEENSSHEYTKAAIKALIEEREKAGWTFAYIGATQEGFAEAGALGISIRSKYTPSGIGTQSAFTAMATSTMAYTAAPDAAAANTAYLATNQSVIPEDLAKTTAPAPPKRNRKPRVASPS